MVVPRRLSGFAVAVVVAVLVAVAICQLFFDNQVPAAAQSTFLADYRSRG